MEKYFQLNENSLCVNCKLYAASQTIKRIILFGHGFSGNKDNRTARVLYDTISRFDETSAMLTLDFPAHGDDTSEALTVERCLQYISTALNFIRAELKPNGIYGGGVSFGGYLMLRYIAEHGNPFQKLVLRSPAVNMYHVLTKQLMSSEEVSRCLAGGVVMVGSSNKVAVKRELIASLAKSDILEYSFKPFASDIFIVHGADDAIVCFENVKQFAEINGISYTAVEAAGHHFSDPEKLNKAIGLMAEELYH